MSAMSAVILAAAFIFIDEIAWMENESTRKTLVDEAVLPKWEGIRCFKHFKWSDI